MAYNFQSDNEEKAVDAESLIGISSTHQYGEWIETPFYRFRVLRGPELESFLVEQSAMSSSFQFRSYGQIAVDIIENLKTQSNEKQQSSLLTLELEGHLIQRLADYLNASVDELQAYELREKEFDGGKHHRVHRQSIN